MGACDGRVAAVTGGTSGIGLAVARALLREGASVAVCGRSEERGAKALAELGAGERAVYIGCDARQRDDVDAFVDQVGTRLGPVDILVNNAGGTDGFALIHELSDDAWQRAADLCLNSAFWATRRALPHMLERGWGRIIFISSVEGKQANKPMVSHYITMKHALNGFAKAVACEYGPMGITSNAICPGAVETETMQTAGRSAAEAAGITYEAFLDGYAQESMIKRLVKAEEVAAMAVLLASEAGGGITGSLLNVDGGTASW